MTKKQTFEDALQDLEAIVQELEQGDLPLEQAMKKFEKGMALTTFCSQKLDETEKKINMLMADPSGNVTPQPFPGKEDSEEG